MGKKKKNDIILRVTTTRFYAVPKDNERNLDFLIEDWFYRHDMHSRHAAREHHEIGYSERVDNVEEISWKTYEDDVKKKIEQRKKLKDLCQWCRHPKDDVREVELRWGAKFEEVDHPLCYKVCPECRKALRGSFRYKKVEGENG